MQHGRKNRKFGREIKPRKELMRDLARALIDKGRITTTQAKAKSLRVYAEKLITRGKSKNLASIRILASVLGSNYAKKLTTEIADKYAERKGGYLRVINLPKRLGDGAKMAVIQFVK